MSNTYCKDMNTFCWQFSAKCAYPIYPIN